jgi:tRNA pseudouridine65 synthase
MIEIIYDDEYCIVVNKPNNILVHHSYYSRNITDDSLLQLLRKQFVNQNFYPLHRLDRKTSGLLLLAKKKEYISKFQDLFTSHSIQKKYYALVRGYCEESGKIDSRVKNPDTGVYKDALTLYKKISQIELNIPVSPYSTSRYSLLELQPKTGRMHQLRKHMNKIAHPIIGDHKYGNRHHNQMFETKFGLDYLFLHAHTLEFKHPFIGENITLNLQVPIFWRELFKKLNWDFKTL